MPRQFRNSSKRKTRVQVCALLVSVTCPLAYAADPGQVVVPYVQYTYLHDDNLLRLNSPEAAQAALTTATAVEIMPVLIAPTGITEDPGAPDTTDDTSPANGEEPTGE